MWGAKYISITTASLLGLVGCTMQDGSTVSRDVSGFAPVYQGIRTDLLEGDLVNFHVEMLGARSPADVESYAECAAAQYALIRGYGFARHVRTSVSEENGLWSGDAVYTVSAALPPGTTRIDAEVTVAACGENEIPTV